MIHYSRGKEGNRYRFAIVDYVHFNEIQNKNKVFKYSWYNTVAGLSNTYLENKEQFLIVFQELPETSENIERNWRYHSHFVVSTNESEIDNENQKSMFVETVMNSNSNFRISFNSAYRNRTWNYITEGWINLSGGSDGSPEKITDGDIIEAFDLFKSNEEVDLNFFIGGGKSETVIMALESLAKLRKDCLVIADVPEECVVNNKGFETTAIVSWRKGLAPYTDKNLNISSDRVCVYANWLEVYDKWNKKYRFIPCSGHIAGVFAYSDSVSECWFASAGLNRGIISGSIRKLAFNPSKAERDLLYINGINAVVSFASSGKVVWGNKTMLASTSSFSSINVRRLFDYIEKNTLESLKVYVFEPNDEYTRSQIVTMIEPFMRDIKARRGVYEYNVVCDSRNNTEQRIEAKELWLDIMIKPTRSAEMIIVRFTNTSYGTNFDEIASSLGM